MLSHHVTLLNRLCVQKSILCDPLMVQPLVLNLYNKWAYCVSWCYVDAQAFSGHLMMGFPWGCCLVNRFFGGWSSQGWAS